MTNTEQLPEAPTSEVENKELSPEFIKTEVEKIQKTVEENAARVAKLGEWPAYIDVASLVDRIPKEGETKARGFDAGMACTLGLIPENRQELAAKLHANYTEEVVGQVREEIKKHDPNSPTTWWLAACSICAEGTIDQQKFLKQVEDFKKLVADETARLEVAERMYEQMTHTFEVGENGPIGEEDGCIQGAYIDGFPFASQYSKEYDLYYIGTNRGTDKDGKEDPDPLGLVNFPWSLEKDKTTGKLKSGPKHGSTQFFMCANEDEWRRAIAIVKEKWKYVPPSPESQNQ